MKHRFLLTAAVLLLGLGQRTAAQVTVEVVGHDESSTSYTLDASGEVYFSGDHMVILESILTGNTHSIELDSVRRVLLSGGFEGIAAAQSVCPAIYPNPAREGFRIQSLPSATATLSLFAADGRRVMEQSVSEGTWVDISYLPSGLYFVRIGETCQKLAKL